MNVDAYLTGAPSERPQNTVQYRSAAPSFLPVNPNKLQQQRASPPQQTSPQVQAHVSRQALLPVVAARPAERPQSPPTSPRQVRATPVPHHVPATVEIPQLTTLCPGGDFLWALDAQGGVWRWNGAAFDKVPGKLRSLSVGNDGAVWGTDYQGNIYRRTQNGWQQVRGRLTSVAVGHAGNVWVR